MNNKEYVIPNIDGINVTSNELINRYTLNRNFEKLLQNDKALNKLIYDNLLNIYNVKEYIPYNSYNKGQYIWFKSELNGNVNIYILESLHNNNTTYPALELVGNKYSFENSGWRDKNEVMSLLANSLRMTALNTINNKLKLFHEYDVLYHKFGKLTSDKAQIDTVLMNSDMSNVKQNRSNVFYPYQTIAVPSDNVITNGFYRKWDNGLLEYDIIYRLGYVGKEIFNGVNYESISCNTLILEDLSNSTDSMVQNDNAKYFLSSSDFDIFSSSNDGSVTLKDMIQHNMAYDVNTYSASINFPVAFKDLNYMVFGSDMTRQERDTDVPTIDSGANSITYTNKSRSSITPIYVMFQTSESDEPKSGLVSNSFHCQIIGRWK